MLQDFSERKPSTTAAKIAPRGHHLSAAWKTTSLRHPMPRYSTGLPKRLATGGLPEGEVRELRRDLRCSPIGGSLREKWMRSHRIGAGFGVLLCLLLATIVDRREARAAPAENGTARQRPVAVLVELFTSEGCSSCPPADTALLTLASEQPVPGAEVIALEEHVDYWNRLGWTDPFSSRALSLRQDEYGGAFGGGRVYTPQMIVDGHTEFVGSDLARAREAVAQATRGLKVAVRISGTPGALSGDLFTVRIESGPYDGDAGAPELWVAITEDGLATDVLAGENGGRKLRHAAVVRSLQKVGIQGPSFAADARVRIDKAWVREQIRIVAFVQDGTSHRVLGAGATPLRTLLKSGSQP
jgi:hypothetical protein